ncbi:hypothetical protein K2173_009145 [Erythroxylum novogranatense]|uniref:DUF7026 domain-containing protein n=1 Tax=Erythroxylum novogranatense TaxID=1862640 RepID=A0AAV8TD72_9ROSI|nr:hypothetical protein K2173_009145 [Erythroxylum novogranatense]
MALSLLCPCTLFCPIKLKFRSFSTSTFLTNRAKSQILCNKDSGGDADLASDFATEAAKINTQLAQREEAMKKSKELLFTELCHYLAMEASEVNRKWSKMDQEEKLVLVKGFVNEWSVNFHPLSARSVKDMIEEYINEENSQTSNSSASLLFPDFRKMMGFYQNK